MSARPEPRSAAGPWLERAGSDLWMAEHALAAGADCPADAVAFHAQQCAEKSLKALLAAQGADFPPTHDLLLLLRLAGAGGALDLTAQDILSLNRYAVEARYPGVGEPITRAEAEAATALARRVRAVVLARLKIEG